MDCKVTWLQDCDALAYMRFQILDTLHDTFHDQQRHEVDAVEVNALVTLYVYWLCEVNRLTAREGEEIARRVISTFDAQKKIDPVYEFAAVTHVAQLYQTHREMVDADMYVIDSCINKDLCKFKSANALPTWSTLYDQGAFGSTCATPPRSVNTMVRIRDRHVIYPTIPHMSVFREVAEKRDANLPFTYMRIPVCMGVERPIAGNHSLAIASAFELEPGVYKPIILAYRGFVQRVEDHSPCGIFAHYLDHNRFVQRGWGQSAKNVESIVKAWLRLYARDGCPLSAGSRHHSPWIVNMPTVTQLLSAEPEYRDYFLRIYVEISAKHWGDLGLALDALMMGVFVLTTDHPLIMFCSILGAAYYNEGLVYKPQNHPLICASRNDENIFDQIRQFKPTTCGYL